MTDVELGLDDFSFSGVDGQTWVDTNFAFAETFGLNLLTDVDGNAVLGIGSNDTVTFEGVSEADFLAFYVDSGLLLC
ncbi:MAG: hypothetical protein ACU0BK_00165 [Shimia sp.]|uniref:hypothetical protein n=1 Tax=Shimia sp. TaxID=1954381 RepID=UPI0040593AB1